MQRKSIFNFDYSYLSLPEKFYSFVKPVSVIKPELFLLNDRLCDELNLFSKKPEHFTDLLSCEESTNVAKSFAQAYAGHQFGHFTKLGDGRAIIIGEHTTENNKRFDVQLKGSGKTLYSRGGDGKATLSAMLREYLMSEAIYHLKIPTSRSLAVVKTGEPVYRETIQEGAVLVRVMKSHIRVGTFEYASQYGSTEDLKALTNYTIKRLYPEIEAHQNPALSLLNKVIESQIGLVVNWLRVGFVHGVMNTDNTAITGETFDYGPCAFINAYHPKTVYSSIDHYGRYAFGNQPMIIKWNMAKFAEALLPVIHPEIDSAVELAQNAIDGFDEIWKENYYRTMLNKIGVKSNTPELYLLVEELLALMQKFELDYTNTFLALSQVTTSVDNLNSLPDLKPWLDKWKNIIDNSIGMKHAKELMQQNNPVFIPRNHLVEQALEDAVNGNTSLFKKLLAVVSQPYHYKQNLNEFMKPSEVNFEKGYQTFCGT